MENEKQQPLPLQKDEATAAAAAEEQQQSKTGLEGVGGYDHIPAGAAQAVLQVRAVKMAKDHPRVCGYDFNRGLDYDALLSTFPTMGFQGTNFGKAVIELNRMVCACRPSQLSCVVVVSLVLLALLSLCWSVLLCSLVSALVLELGHSGDCTLAAAHTHTYTIAHRCHSLSFLLACTRVSIQLVELATERRADHGEGRRGVLGSYRTCSGAHQDLHGLHLQSDLLRQS
jgi:hypothetical protein